MIIFCLHSLLATLICISLIPVPASKLGLDVQNNDALVEFPDQIIFQLELGNVLSPVESIELEYGVEKTACVQVSGRVEPDITELFQGRNVQASWTWDFYRSGSMPPGAQIWWQWHINTRDGESRTTPREWLSYDDDRYDWQTLTEDQINVHWYAGDQSFGQQMLRTARQTRSRLITNPQVELDQSIQLYFYANSDDLQGALISPQRWTGGVAFTDFYTILIGAGPEDLDYGQRTVTHELMHLVVHQLSFNCWGDLPRWLDEGLATWSEGDLDDYQREALDKAIDQDSLFSLRQISSAFSAHSDRASLAYAQSQSIVVFMIDVYGLDKILELLLVFREGVTYDGALEQVYGFDTGGLEDLWRASVGAQLRTINTEPLASPTPVPTWDLSTSTPPLSANDTPVPSPSPSPTPFPSTTPTHQVVVAVSATARVTRTPRPKSTFIPAHIVSTQSGNPLVYALGGGVIVGLVALVVGYVWRRQKSDAAV